MKLMKNRSRKPWNVFILPANLSAHGMAKLTIDVLQRQEIPDKILSLPPVIRVIVPSDLKELWAHPESGSPNKIALLALNSSIFSLSLLPFLWECRSEAGCWCSAERWIDTAARLFALLLGDADRDWISLLAMRLPFAPWEQSACWRWASAAAHHYYSEANGKRVPVAHLYFTASSGIHRERRRADVVFW